MRWLKTIRIQIHQIRSSNTTKTTLGGLNYLKWAKYQLQSRLNSKYHKWTGWAKLLVALLASTIEMSLVFHSRIINWLSLTCGNSKSNTSKITMMVALYPKFKMWRIAGPCSQEMTTLKCQGHAPLFLKSETTGLTSLRLSRVRTKQLRKRRRKK